MTQTTTVKHWCQGDEHTWEITDDGELILRDHDVEAEIIARELGAELTPCMNIWEQYHGQGPAPFLLRCGFYTIKPELEEVTIKWLYHALEQLAGAYPRGKKARTLEVLHESVRCAETQIELDPEQRTRPVAEIFNIRGMRFSRASRSCMIEKKKYTAIDVFKVALAEALYFIFWYGEVDGVIDCSIHCVHAVALATQKLGRSPEAAALKEGRWQASVLIQDYKEFHGLV